MNLTGISKFISFILRHNKGEVDIKVDEHGWCNVEELIGVVAERNKGFNMAMLERIVAEDSKNRYSFNDDKTLIRANQGHSIAVDLDLKPVKPPTVLYHGTASRFLDNIKKDGIKSMSRNHVHMSDSIENAFNIGKRHGHPIVLEIDTESMYKDKYNFYRSENGVWLTDFVPEKYILTVHGI